MANNINILLLDDEILALSYLKDTISDVINNNKTLFGSTIYSTTNQTEFWDILAKTLPKIIFLDIQMPRKTGIEIAEEIQRKKENNGYKNQNFPIIIFTTAYDTYGYQAFKVNAFDYILKPIDEDNVLKVFNKILDTYDSFLRTDKETITVHSSGIDIEIPLNDILYFKADMKYIAVITEKKEFLINTTLLILEEKYSQFVKIHRAYLVNPLYFSKFYKRDNHWFLSIKNHEQSLPVSRRQKLEIEKKIDYKLII